jgi:hypothetical protein
MRQGTTILFLVQIHYDEVQTCERVMNTLHGRLPVSTEWHSFASPSKYHKQERQATWLGRRWIFLIGVEVFAAASTAGGFASNIDELIAAR